MVNGSVTPEEEKSVKALGFLRNRGTNNFSGRIITVNGKISADQMICLSEAAKLHGNGVVMMTTRLTIECQGIPFDKIEDFRAYIAKAGLTTGGTGSKVRPVVSCKGTTCQYGLIDTFELSEEIHERFYNGYRSVKLPHKFKIAVGGCPNNCVKPDLNDVGIIGQLIPNFDEDSCSGCKKCAVEKFCPVGAAKMKDGLLEIDEEKCNNCGRCIGVSTLTPSRMGRWATRYISPADWESPPPSAGPLVKSSPIRKRLSRRSNGQSFYSANRERRESALPPPFHASVLSTSKKSC